MRYVSVRFLQRASLRIAAALHFDIEENSRWRGGTSLDEIRVSRQ